MAVITQEENSYNKVASIGSDAIAKILFDDDVLLQSQQTEIYIRRKVSGLLMQLFNQDNSGKITPNELKEKLSALDEFLSGRGGLLSGNAILALCTEIELINPDWVKFFPKSIGVAYQQVRLARIWASLLNKRALDAIAQAVREEKQNEDGFLL